MKSSMQRPTQKLAIDGKKKTKKEHWNKFDCVPQANPILPSVPNDRSSQGRADPTVAVAVKRRKKGTSEGKHQSSGLEQFGGVEQQKTTEQGEKGSKKLQGRYGGMVLLDRFIGPSRRCSGLLNCLYCIRRVVQKRQKTQKKLFLVWTRVLNIPSFIFHLHPSVGNSIEFLTFVLMSNA